MKVDAYCGLDLRERRHRRHQQCELVIQMDEERARRILDKSFATLERLQRAESEEIKHNVIYKSPNAVPRRSYDPVTRHVPEPEPDEAEVRFSDPIKTMPPPAAESSPVIGAPS